MNQSDVICPALFGFSHKLDGGHAFKIRRLHSLSISFSFNLGVDSFEKASHGFHLSLWNELDSVLVLNDVNFFPNLDSEGLPDGSGNDDLKFRGYSHCFHEAIQAIMIPLCGIWIEKKIQ